MVKKHNILVDVSTENIQKVLKSLIKSDYAELISEIIIENLSATEVGLDQLFLALSGIKKQFKYKIFDEVWVKYDNLPTWRFDIQTMKDKGIIIRDQFMKCEIVEVNTLSKTPYLVKFSYYKTDKDENTSEDTYSILETCIIEGVDNEDFLK